MGLRGAEVDRGWRSGEVKVGGGRGEEWAFLARFVVDWREEVGGQFTL